MATTMETVSGGATMMSAKLMTNAASAENLGQKMIAMQGVIATATPIIMGVTAAIGATAIAIHLANQRHEELMANARKEMETNDSLYASTQKIISGYDDYKSRVDALNSSANSYMQSYDDQAAKTDILMSHIEQLTNVESLDTSQKEIMKQAVQQLTDMYPDFKYHIDETSGKLVDQNGHLVTSVNDLEAYAKELKKAAEQQALTNALINKETAFAEQQAEVETLTKSLGELRKKQKQYIKEQTEGNFKHAAQLDAINKDIDDTKTKLGETKKALKDTGSEVDNIKNKIDLGTRLDNLVTSAKNAGIQIPQALADGIKNGKVDVDQATQYLDTYDKYQTMVNNAQQAGLQIPQNIANGILNNAGTVKEQVDSMNLLMNFQQAVMDAGKSGSQIPMSMAMGMVSNLPSVQ